MISAKLKPADEARFAAALQKMVALSGEPVEEILRKQGRLVAVQLARFTQRVGDSKSGGEKQMNRIKLDIGRVYKKAESAVGLIAREWGFGAAERFQKYVLNHNIGKAQDMVDRANLSAKYYQGRSITVAKWDGGAAHTRFKKRKLRGGSPVLLITNYGKVVTFKNKKAAQAGALKAGWARAAADLGGTRGIPGYAKKKSHKTRGHGKVKGKGGKAELSISNRSNYIIQNRKLTDIFRVQATNMEDVIIRMLNRRLKKTKRKFKI